MKCRHSGGEKVLNILERIKVVLQEESEKEGLGMLIVEIFEREEKGEIGYQWKKAYQEAIKERLSFLKEQPNFLRDEG